jgi:hypothetical protein
LAWLSHAFCSLPANQGDLMVQIFAHWAIVYFGQFFSITEVAHMIGYFFLTDKFMH